MSMILDAMKRSKEGDTQSSGVPTVDTVHYVPQLESRFSRWQIGGLLVGALAAVVALIIGLQPAAEEGQLSQVPVVEGQSSESEGKPSGGQSEEILSSQRQRSEKPSSEMQSAEKQRSLGQGASERAIVPSTSRTAPAADSPRIQSQTLVPQNAEDLTPSSFVQSPPQKAESRAQEVEQSGLTRPVVGIDKGSAATRSSNASSSLSAERLGESRAPSTADELQAIYRALNEEANRAVDENQARSLQARSSEDRFSPLTRAAGAGDSMRDAGLNGGNNALLERGVSAVSTQEDEARPVDFAEILAAAQEDLGVKPLVESSEPLLETLSQQIKNEIPSLFYSAHEYEPGGSSSVTLNGKLLRERQRVDAFTVIEILPDSVVLRWRETQFRVRARNSWVNL